MLSLEVSRLYFFPSSLSHFHLAMNPLPISFDILSVSPVSHVPYTWSRKVIHSQCDFKKMGIAFQAFCWIWNIIFSHCGISGISACMLRTMGWEGRSFLCLDSNLKLYHESGGQPNDSFCGHFNLRDFSITGSRNKIQTTCIKSISEKSKTFKPLEEV